MVEQGERLGGTCLLRGCIPTKALLQSAAVMDTVERASEWGIKAAGEPDWSAIRCLRGLDGRQDREGLTGLVKLRGIEVVSGTRRIRSGQTVRGAATERSSRRDVVIASGSRPKMLPGLEIAPRCITSDQALRSTASRTRPS